MEPDTLEEAFNKWKLVAKERGYPSRQVSVVLSIVKKAAIIMIGFANEPMELV